VARVGRRYANFSRDLCDDLVQEVYLKFAVKPARALGDFESRHPGSAFGYVQVVAARSAHDCLKSKNFERTPDSPVDLADFPARDEAGWQQFRREIDDFLRQFASDRDRRIFWLYNRQGLTAKEISAIPGVALTVKGVEGVIGRLNVRIRQNYAPRKRE